jgi:CheY-like chemotaxis protein
MADNKHTSSSKNTVLIVEDDKTSDFYLTEILKDRFEVILHAKDGIEAIESCKKNKVALILMDLKMPRMDGLTATREIRNFDKNVIIIAQTAYAMIGDQSKAVDAGCNDYVTKPIIEKKLISLINQNMASA